MNNSCTLPDVKILLYYESEDYTKDEAYILNYFDRYRLFNTNNRKSEWIKINFDILKNFLDKYFNEKFDKNENSSNNLLIQE